MNALSVIGSTEHNSEDVEAALDAAARGKLTVLIDRVLPLAQAVEAHRIVAAREITGKVLLTPEH
jgi:NADPH:quinone reductase-like Zn-dependent oxidoreductase